MKEELYYFSGTGNSLAIAKKIQDKLTDSKLLSIANIKKNEKIDIQTNIVIISPIYMYNIPHIVRDFIENLEGEGLCRFIFAGGGETGKSVKVIKKLFSGNKIILNSIFNI
ncbi:MAG: hypothetical protein GY756_14480, partial [bacterium]|nr:hypothetical protein [bacterium]